MTFISMIELLGSPYLTGATKAQDDLPKLIRELTKVKLTETVVFDFKKIQHVSASYWNGIVPAIYSFAADEERDIFPVICNVEENSLEELVLALKNRGMAVLTGNTDGNDLGGLELIGTIDDAHKKTYDLINSHGKVGAGDLVSKNKKKKEGELGLSAWSNRLAALYRMRLIRREKQGRSFRYKPIIED